MTKRLFQEWSNALTFKEILKHLDVKFVGNPESAKYDFSLENLDKNTFIDFFEK